MQAPGGGGVELFSVGVFKEHVSVQWRLGPGAGAPRVKSLRTRSHLHWTTLRFSLAPSRERITGTVQLVVVELSRVSRL